MTFETEFDSLPITVRACKYVGVAGPYGSAFPENMTAQMLYSSHVPIEPTAHWGGSCGEPECTNNFDLLLHVANGDSYSTIHPGDWIIEESNGSGFYPCVGTVFAARYNVTPRKIAVLK